MKLKKILSFGLAVTCAASLAACGSSSGAAAGGSGAGGNVIKIGVFEPTTGENGGGGYQEVLGIRYANETHKTVKIGDTEYTIELVEVDNKSDKTEAVNAANKLMGEKVSVVLGSYGSGVSIAAGQIFADAKVPAIGCSCTNPQVTQGNEYYFRVCFLDPFQGTVMANYAMQNGYKNAAILTQLGDDYSSGLGSYFKTAFEELGGTVVDEEQFQTNQTDFKAVLTNIKAKNPDVIFAPSSITTAPLIIKQARELGIESLLAAGDTWENSTIIDNAGSDAEGAVLSTFFDEAEPANAEAESFIKGFKEYLKKNDQSDIIPAVSALGYDAYLAAYNAIEKAQSADGEAIKEALKGVSYDGVTGAISFNEEGDANKDMAFIKTVKDGAFQFLTTTTISG
ncbi:amino acid ABC transporter substrate-binding protein [Oribacterium sp. C9]|uniref:ABC transporter substrate-binding protein n=1 Tax=Oribacterium sp. C9 TaxID=1943579 RepID=UPI00098EDBD5|nr:ABC transporter substrate-binding protein [Oribacterium sp. C9]OON87715.1 amino acid ABC transporter substrate-binding protein [Oribacterium sp. C9]